MALALHRRGECTQRALGVGDDDLRRVDGEFMRDQRGHATAVDRRPHVRMAVEPFTLERDEQGIAARQCAGVGGDTVDHAIGADQAAAGGLRNEGERTRRHDCNSCVRRRNNSRATAVSSNAWRMPAISW